MTTTTRERFEEQFMRDGELLLPEGTDDASDIIEFIETIEKEAEARGIQQGREEMRKECLKYFTNGQCGNMEEVYESISSLK